MLLYFAVHAVETESLLRACSHVVRCSMLQYAAVRCSMIKCVVVCCRALWCVALCYSVLQCVAVRYSVVQCVAVCCNVLQCVVQCVAEVKLLFFGLPIFNVNTCKYIHISTFGLHSCIHVYM